MPPSNYKETDIFYPGVSSKTLTGLEQQAKVFKAGEEVEDVGLRLGRLGLMFTKGQRPHHLRGGLLRQSHLRNDQGARRFRNPLRVVRLWTRARMVYTIDIYRCRQWPL